MAVVHHAFPTPTDGVLSPQMKKKLCVRPPPWSSLLPVLSQTKCECCPQYLEWLINQALRFSLFQGPSMAPGYVAFPFLSLHPDNLIWPSEKPPAPHATARALCACMPALSLLLAGWGRHLPQVPVVCLCEWWLERCNILLQDLPAENWSGWCQSRLGRCVSPPLSFSFRKQPEFLLSSPMGKVRFFLGAIHEDEVSTRGHKNCTVSNLCTQGGGNGAPKTLLLHLAFCELSESHLKAFP